MWRQAVRHHRCLVPATGWYEWQKSAEGGRKQPFYIHSADDVGICFAGLWSTHLHEGAEQHTFAILTRAAAAELAHIHNRMPLVLPPTAFGAWLDPAIAGSQSILDQAIGQSLTQFASYPVSAYVSSPRNQGERCIAPLN
jgi:putative SOS response-associated peptidase YedK